ncbi:MAG: hypothetical protein Q9227_007477 [Pyrenula ochraceoflavens]
MNEEESLRLAAMDTELAEAIKANPILSQSVPYGDIREMRKMFSKPQLGPAPPAIEETDIEIAMPDGHQNPARIFKPTRKIDSPKPLVVLFHGGGFCFGDYTYETEVGRALVESLPVIAISIGYRLAPEHPFPAPITDAWDGLKWAAKNAPTFGADPAAGFIVGGTSAGGSMSACLAHMARDAELTPPLTGQYLCITTGCPAVMMPEKYKKWLFSDKHNKDAPGISSETLRMFREAHNPPKTPDERFAALLNPNGHKELPRAYFQHCGMDPLRDEGIIYQKVLEEEGDVKTKSDMYPGLPHGFWSTIPNSQVARKRLNDVVKGVEWLFRSEA